MIEYKYIQFCVFLLTKTLINAIFAKGINLLFSVNCIRLEEETKFFHRKFYFSSHSHRSGFSNGQFVWKILLENWFILFTLKPFKNYD
jgi:hypothetical protein